MINDVLEAVDRISDDIISTASDLIKIPTRNPPGEEKNCLNYLVSRIREFNLDYKIIYEPFANRPQVIAWNSDEPKVLLNGHIDTVPEGDADRWSIDPFSGIVKDGMLYGRGAADMKGSLAIILNIARFIDGLLLMFAVGEERAEEGTKAMLKHIPNTIKHGIVLEPTSLAIANAQKGALWIRYNIHGKATHASLPDKGVNAILNAKEVIDKVKEYDHALRSKKFYNTNPTCSITMIQGGIKENVIPDTCHITIDRRLLPDESIDHALYELKRFNEDLDVLGYRKPTMISKDAKVCKAMKQALNHLSLDARFACFNGATDNEYIVEHGIESIVWGAGDLAKAHAIDECISIDELILASKVLALSLNIILNDEAS